MSSSPGRKQISSRRAALEALLAITEGGAYSNMALKSQLTRGSWTDQERSLLTELVYGTVRVMNTLDWSLGHFLKGTLADLPAPIRNVLRLGAYQILYLDKIPARAAVHESVELAKIYGHQGVASLVNGVLRTLIRRQEELKFPSLQADPVGHISLKYSHPRWLVEKWLWRFGAKDTIALCQYNNSPAPLSIRVNTLRISREELQDKLKEKGVLTRASRWVPEGLIIEKWQGLEGLAEFQEGLFLLQDESSILVSHALRPEEGSLVLDACAAPGTKTTHLAQLMKNRGKIIAFDLYPHKLALIQDNCRRLGVKIVETKCADARNAGEIIGEKVDFALVDAPCSGLGVLGRRADARWRKTPDQPAQLARIQLAILQGVASALKSGGILVYSTCSLAEEENEEVVKEFLAANDGFYLEDLTGVLPCSWQREEDLQSLRSGYWQILPQAHGIDGFFLARFRKKN
ncbi:MAG: 16S rRNA (cytosine(967)-C(5))-methyltransferase RsmB [Clostridia bacterium]|jgi:16S rRNA (cytosine967-C5)-methyltransferase|nr:16S rRNA (cytosine(967)-C(5))-methyltransferase RsmB [Clostridia bacterium]